jgi:hypothetical protein
MPIQMQFVVSFLGQDIFYNGSGNVTSNIYEAQIYTTFASAEIGAGEASFQFQMIYGSYGWEIRTIGVGV